MGGGPSLGRRARTLGGERSDAPSEMLREHRWMHPFVEDDVVGLIVELFGGRDEATRRHVLGTNRAAMLGFPDAKLALA